MKKSTRKSRRQRNPHSKEEAKQPFFTKKNKVSTKVDTPFFQPKLTVGKPNDKYEQEADQVADTVVNKSNNTPAIQQKNISSIQRYMTNAKEDESGTNTQRIEKDKMIQEKPIQKMEEEEPVQMMEEEESLQAKEEEEPIQKKEEEESVQMMEEEESLQAKEEEEVQTKEEEETVQAKEEEEVQAKEEEEAVQMKSNNATPNTASPAVAKQLKQSKGGGSALPKSTKAEMESSFGVDFSQVNIHTNDKAVQMNKELGAQAFTHGKDVYFNKNKFSPTSKDGKQLLAHELTHVVQQGGGIKKKPSKMPSLQKSPINAGVDAFARVGKKIQQGVGKLAAAIMREAKFQQMWNAFPKGDVDNVKSKIGGKVDADWINNTCAIRVSRVLNYSGNSVPFKKGETISGKDKKWYFYRVRNLRPFIESIYGAPDVTLRSPFDRKELKKHKGIIQFDETNFSDATGHFTLWNGTTCADQCYFDQAGVVHIWYP